MYRVDSLGTGKKRNGIPPIVGRIPAIGLRLVWLRLMLSLGVRAGKLKFSKNISLTRIDFLIMDRAGLARDNGESLFRRLIEQGENCVRFAISKDSNCGQRLDREGFGQYLVEPHSSEFWQVLVNARVIAFSQRDVDTYSTVARMFFGQRHSPKVVYLRHGIQHTSNDIVDLQHRYDILCCSVSAEIQHLASVYGSIARPEHSLKQLGMARFDKYKSIQTRRQDQILIVPTWRSGKSSFVRSLDTQLRDYSTEWLELVSKLLSLGSKVVLIPHPLLDERMIRQIESRGAVVMGFADIDFQNEVRKSRVLVTDFSSTALEALFAGTPVILFRSQMDESYTKSHLAHSLEFDLLAEKGAHICKTTQCAFLDTERATKSDGLTADENKMRDAIFEGYPSDSCTAILNAVRSL